MNRGPSTATRGMFALIAMVVAADAAGADSGRVGNALDVPVTFAVGSPGPTGLTWTEHTLGPCASEVWTADLPEGASGLVLSWPLWIDARKDGYGQTIMTSAALPLSPDGSATVTFFRLGDQVWVDGSANAKDTLANCEGGEPASEPLSTASPAPPTPPSGSSTDEALPEELAAQLAALLRKVDTGEILLLEIPGADGGSPRIIPMSVQDFQILTTIAVWSGRMDDTDAAEFISLAARHSKVLATELLVHYDLAPR